MEQYDDDDERMIMPFETIAKTEGLEGWSDDAREGGSYLNSPFASSTGFFLDLSEEDFASNTRHCVGSEAQNDGPIRGGLTQEHLNKIGNRNWKAVLSWIAFHPNEISRLVDREGQTALHHLCLFRAPHEVVEALLFCCAELASVANDEGELPLHWAARLALPMETFKLLLQANPKGGFARDSKGVTPFSLLWDRHDLTLWDIFRQHGATKVFEFHSWKRLMLLIDCYCGVEHSSKRGPILHTISSCPCPPSLLRFAVALCRNELPKKDDQGRLPLATVASSPPVDPATDMLKITILLDVWPVAARATDSEGRSPLHLAIEAGKTWEGGVHALLKAEPQSLTLRDPVTLLLPFMKAAVGPGELDTVFMLLRSDPECVRHAF